MSSTPLPCHDDDGKISRRALCATWNELSIAFWVPCIHDLPASGRLFLGRKKNSWSSKFQIWRSHETVKVPSPPYRWDAKKGFVSYTNISTANNESKTQKPWSLRLLFSRSLLLRHPPLLLSCRLGRLRRRLFRRKYFLHSVVEKFRRIPLFRWTVKNYKPPLLMIQYSCGICLYPESLYIHYWVQFILNWASARL